MERLDLGPLTILVPKGRLAGDDETKDLDDAIGRLIQEGNLRLIIDLSETEYLRPVALGVLTSALSNYNHRGGILRLCCLNENVKHLMRMTKLDTIFIHYPTRQGAIDSFDS